MNYESKSQQIEVENRIVKINKNLGILIKILDDNDEQVSFFENDNTVVRKSLEAHKADVLKDKDDLVTYTDEQQAIEQSHLDDYKVDHPSGTAILSEIQTGEQYTGAYTRMVKLLKNTDNDDTNILDASKTELDTDNDYNSVKEVKDVRSDTIIGINKRTAEDEPAYSVNLMAEPGLSRSLNVVMFDSFSSNEIANNAKVKTSIPYTIEYKPTESVLTNLNRRPIYIELNRQHSVQAFDFGVQILTKRDTFTRIGEDIRDFVTVEETFENHVASAYVKRYFGSIILTGCHIGEIPDIQMILNTAETEMGVFEPTFNFRFTFDDTEDKIYLWLESVTPYRLSWFDIFDVDYLENLGDDIETQTKLSTVFIRDLMELMSPYDETTNLDTQMLKISDKWGQKGYGILMDHDDNAQIKNMLEILRTCEIVDDKDELFIIPHFMVTLSLKDNTFDCERSFPIKNLANLDLMNSGTKLNWDIIPKTNTMIQLSNIPITQSNHMKRLSEKATLTISNTELSYDKKSYVHKFHPSDIVDQTKEFISNFVKLNKPVSYTIRTFIQGQLNSGDKTFNNTTLPEYVIDEIGKCVIEIYTDGEMVEHEIVKFYSMAYVYNKYYMSEDDNLIDNVFNMKKYMTEGTIPVKIFKSYDSLGNIVYDEITDEKLKVIFNNKESGGSSYPLMIFSDPNTHTLFEKDRYDETNKFTGLIKSTVEISDANHIYRDMDIEHITSIDGFGIPFGSDENNYENEINVKRVLEHSF